MSELLLACLLGIGGGHRGRKCPAAARRDRRSCRAALDFAGEEAAARVRLRADRLDLSAALRSCRRDECPG